MRQRVLGRLAAAGLLVSLVACQDATSPATASTSAAASAAADDGESSPYSYDTLDLGGREAISVRIPGSPDWLAADDEHVYVARDEGGFTALDPETAEVTSSFQIDGRRCQGIGAEAGTVFTCAGGDLLLVDSASGDVRASVAVTKAAEQGHFGIGFGRVWFLLGDGTSLVGIDTDSLSLGEPIVIPIHGTDLAISSDRIWVVSGVVSAAVEIDPESGAIGRRIDGLTGARAAVAIPGAVWVGGSSASYRIDTATGAITVTVDGGIGYDGGISADDSTVWVRKGGLSLERLDSSTGTILEELSAEIAEVVGRGGDALVAFGAIWVTFYDDATVIRIPLD